MIFNVLKKLVFVLGTHLYMHYVSTAVSTYSYLHSNSSYIDVYKEIFRIFHHFIFTLIFIYIYSA